MSDEKESQAMPYSALMVEFVATTLFLFITMTAIAAKPRDWTDVALVFGGSIAVLIMVFTRHSGAHMNPAVTAALWVTKRLDTSVAIAYVAAQLLGGILGSYLAMWVLPDTLDLSQGSTQLAHNVTPVAGLFVEVALTFLLVVVVFATAVDHRNDRRFAPLAIGLTVAICVLAGGHITGAALNPARWLGPALVDGQWANISTYTAGPLLGGMLGALAYTTYLLPKDQEASLQEIASDAEEE